MTGWLVLAAYCAGYVYTYRKAYVFADDDMAPRDSFDLMTNVMLGMFAAMIWPAVLLGWVLYKGFTPVTPREREQQLKDRERHIANLERELGIR